MNAIQVLCWSMHKMRRWQRGAIGHSRANSQIINRQGEQEGTPGAPWSSSTSGPMPGGKEPAPWGVARTCNGRGHGGALLRPPGHSSVACVKIACRCSVKSQGETDKWTI